MCFGSSTSDASSAPVCVCVCIWVCGSTATSSALACTRVCMRVCVYVYVCLCVSTQIMAWLTPWVVGMGAPLINAHFMNPAPHPHGSLGVADTHLVCAQAQRTHHFLSSLTGLYQGIRRGPPGGPIVEGFISRIVKGFISRIVKGFISRIVKGFISRIVAA